MQQQQAQELIPELAVEVQSLRLSAVHAQQHQALAAQVELSSSGRNSYD
jgi:hypothetical protein